MEVQQWSKSSVEQPPVVRRHRIFKSSKMSQACLCERHSLVKVCLGSGQLRQIDAPRVVRKDTLNEVCHFCIDLINGVLWSGWRQGVAFPRFAIGFIKTELIANWFAINHQPTRVFPHFPVKRIHTEWWSLAYAFAKPGPWC